MDCQLHIIQRNSRTNYDHLWHKVESVKGSFQVTDIEAALICAVGQGVV
jgi:hypothetical protein